MIPTISQSVSYVFAAPENDFKVKVVSLMESDAGDWMSMSWRQHH
jgi:hypothetical protein